MCTEYLTMIICNVDAIYQEVVILPQYRIHLACIRNVPMPSICMIVYTRIISDEEVDGLPRNNFCFLAPGTTFKFSPDVRFIVRTLTFNVKRSPRLAAGGMMVIDMRVQMVLRNKPHTITQAQSFEPTKQDAFYSFPPQLHFR